MNDNNLEYGLPEHNWQEPMEICQPIKPSWSVEIGMGFKIQYTEGRQPNRFHRWMQRMFLGFKWERICDE